MKRRIPSRLPWVRHDRLATPAELDWLAGEEGKAVCAAMAFGDRADTPAAIDRWRSHLDAEKVAVAWAQVELRAAARRKFTHADEMLFDRVGLEQATDEIVACHKAQRFAGCGQVVDLCCGIGGDALALAGYARMVAVDWSTSRTKMASHNAAVYGNRMETLNEDAAFCRPEGDGVHIDPDRRSDGRRRHDPIRSSPGLNTLREVVEHYQHAAIKLSPGVELDQLPLDGELELISHRGECKQAVLWTGKFQNSLRRATVLPAGEFVAVTRREVEDLIWPDLGAIRPGCLLFEPDPAVIRAGLVGKVARLWNLAPIDSQIALLVGEKDIETVLLRSFRVWDVTDWSLKKARVWLREHNVGTVDIKTRGFAARPEEIQKRLRLKGERQAVLFLTRIREKPVAILAQRGG